MLCRDVCDMRKIRMSLAFDSGAFQMKSHVFNLYRSIVAFMGSCVVIRCFQSHFKRSPQVAYVLHIEIMMSDVLTCADHFRFLSCAVSIGAASGYTDTHRWPSIQCMFLFHFNIENESTYSLQLQCEPARYCISSVCSHYFFLRILCMNVDLNASRINRRILLKRNNTKNSRREKRTLFACSFSCSNHRNSY